MKIISIILAVLILGLSMHPCSDSLTCILMQENNQAANTHTHCSQHANAAENDHTHEDESQSHDCTPFCSCACCGINILVQYPIISVDVKVGYNELPTIYFNFQYSFEYFPPIWQPPQVS